MAARVAYTRSHLAARPGAPPPTWPHVACEAGQRMPPWLDMACHRALHVPHEAAALPPRADVAGRERRVLPPEPRVAGPVRHARHSFCRRAPVPPGRSPAGLLPRFAGGFAASSPSLVSSGHSPRTPEVAARLR